MIKILHLITSFGLGGAETNLWRLACHMDRSRFANVVVTMTPTKPDQGTVEPTPEEAGVPFFTLGMQRGTPDPLSAARLLRIVRRVRPQILQTWLYHADLMGLLVGKFARVPVIAWNLRCSFMDMTEYSRVSKYVLRTLVALSPFPNAVLANSQSGLRFHEALGYKPRRWMWIPNSLDLERFRPDPIAKGRLQSELGLGPDALLVGLVARFDPMKDHKNFIEAARLLTHDNPRIHFVLAGRRVDSANDEIAGLIAETGVADRFHLLGLRHDVNRIVPGFDIACSSSYSEGFSNTIAEAMACGVPCVATDVGDSALIIANTGKAVPPRDPQAFAQACREILSLPPERRRRLSQCARASVEQRFSLSSVVARYERLYEQLAPTTLHNLTTPI